MLSEILYGLHCKEDLTDFLFQTGKEFWKGLFLYVFAYLYGLLQLENGMKAGRISSFRLIIHLVVLNQGYQRSVSDIGGFGFDIRAVVSPFVLFILGELVLLKFLVL